LFSLLFLGVLPVLVLFLGSFPQEINAGIRREPMPVSCKDRAVWLFPDQPEQPGRAIRLSGKIMKNLIPQINTMT
jgi:hypothetical protein